MIRLAVPLLHVSSSAEAEDFHGNCIRFIGEGAAPPGRPAVEER